ncbi:hypothetical protein V1509DRAFT_95783 [Lipomyces kononenkoae]
MASSESTIPLELRAEAEQERETSRAVLRARAHSSNGGHDSASPRTSADSGSTGGGGGSLGNDPDEEDRYELSFVIRSPATVTVSEDVWPPIIVRIRRFRGNGEIIPSASLVSTSPVSERSHSSVRSSEEATNISGSEHSSGGLGEDGVILLCQLALYDADDEYARIDTSPLQGITVLSPQVYLDPQRLSDAHDNNNSNNSNNNNRQQVPARGVHRYFGLFSNFRVTESGHYSLSVTLLQGVGLAPLMHGQVAPAGRQLARITLPITAVDAREVVEHGNGVLADEDRRILQHFHEQGADVPIY